MHNTIFANSAVRRFASVISILLATVAFLWTVPSDATTNVGTAGAQFLKIGPGGASGQFGRCVWRACQRCHYHLLESSRVKPTQTDQLLGHPYNMACGYPIQLPRVRHAGRKGRHLGRKRYIS